MNTPFWADWTFWAFVSSAIAIVLSQLPPIRQWWSRARVVVETSDRILLNHQIGYPNVMLFMSLRNIGGRSIRVYSVVLDISRHGQPVCSITGNNYLVGQQNLRLYPFTLAPSDEKSATVSFYNWLVAHEDRELGRLRRNLKEDIAGKVRARREVDPDAKGWVEADPSVLRPVLALFERKFVWDPGEYEADLRVTLKNIDGSATDDVVAKFRFTLYDTDSAELRSHATDYKYGFGPAIDYEMHENVTCQLHRVQ